MERQPLQSSSLFAAETRRGGKRVECWICIAVAIAIFAVHVWCWVDHSRRYRQYLERHPPISDEEFLRRCSPEVRPEIALQVRRIIHEVFGIDYDRISPEMNLVELDNNI